MPLMFISLMNVCMAQGLFIKGQLKDVQTKKPVALAKLSLESTTAFVVSGDDGWFLLKDIKPGDHIIKIEAYGYEPKRLPLFIDPGQSLNVGIIYLETDMKQEIFSNLVILTDSELSDEEGEVSTTSGLLQSSRDVYLNRAAFDLSQAFYKVRGYDSREGMVLFNGLPMNGMFNGRPQWNNWGGINDVMRIQEFSEGIAPTQYGLGGILATTNFLLRPSLSRRGLRISSSFSNRNYAGRLMATYNSGTQKNGLTYAFSASRRWSGKGYVEGTLYDAFSLYGSLEFNLSERNILNAVAIYTPNRRGSSAPLTEEVFELKGRKYNPYWGEQNGELRNSRERKIKEPIILLSHFYEGKRLKLSSSVSYQTGSYSRSRLGYYNAPNPDPVYYRYLPSFYINNPSGSIYENAQLAEIGFLNNSQIDWTALYSANMNQPEAGKSVYILYDDVTQNRQWRFGSVANVNVSGSIRLDLGFSQQFLNSENFALIGDLLGGEYHEDIDPFSETSNDLNGDPSKVKDERFGYNYIMDAFESTGFVQLRLDNRDWEAFFGSNVVITGYRRNGLFLNERYPDISFGKSDELRFVNFSFKAGLVYKFSGRHIFSLNSAYLKRAPTIQNSFVNSRESNEVVPGISSERIMLSEASYILRFPKLYAKLSAYYTGFEGVTEIGYFYTDSGAGSDFVQEVITGMDKRHYGAELGISYDINSAVKLTAVAATGSYEYANDPDITINFDTAGNPDEIIDPAGFLDLGKAAVKNHQLPSGPRKMYSAGIEYRDPDYWWVGLTGNYLGNNYIDISTISRTQSFYTDPASGATFSGISTEPDNELLRQKPLEDVYLLNLTAGKSWLVNKQYISLFASLNNIFDSTYRTGGFEQSRNGNYSQLSQDMLRDNPSFGPKYWYGYGRTFFINLAISF